MLPGSGSKLERKSVGPGEGVWCRGYCLGCLRRERMAGEIQLPSEGPVALPRGTEAPCWTTGGSVRDLRASLQEEAGQPVGLFPKAGTVALKQIQFFLTVSRLFLESLRFRIKFFLKLWEVLLVNKGSTGTPEGLTPCQANKGGALRNNHRSV